MRIRPHLLIALCLATSSGCMALDELDKASAKMKPAPAKSAKAEPGKTEADAPNALVQQSKEWWSTATSFSTKNVDSSIVRCRISSGTKYMSKDDCLSRGGSAEGL